MVTPQEQAALNEVMQMLEATPDAAEPTGLASLVTPGNDIPAKRERLAVLVSTGKAKEALAFSSHTTRSNACRIKMCRSTTNARKLILAVKPPSP